MRAAVCTRYGPPEVLQMREVPTPAPRPDEVLVRIRAAAVTVSDCYIRSAVPTARLTMRVMARVVIGFRRPRRPILGMALAGDVETTGARVRAFRPGDRVFAATLLRQGAYAQYTCVREAAVVAATPANLGDDEAAALPYGGLIALHFLRKAGVAPGQQVLVYGASGAIGTAAVQLAVHMGAEVTAACGPANGDLVRSLGAARVLDYTRDATPGDARYALVFDAVGRRKTSPLKIASQTALAPGGACVSVDDGMPRMERNGLRLLRDLAAAGALRAVIDRRYPLEQIADAHRYVEQGHKRGNVVVTID